VCEIVFGRSTAFDDAPPPEFIQFLGNTALVPIRRLLQQFEREGSTDYTRQAGEFVRSCRQLCLFMANS
jgi:hypothetical protein